MVLHRRRITRSAGVRLELAVLEYLRELAEREDRDRSYCINRIVREHAEQEDQENREPGADPVHRPAEQVALHLVAAQRAEERHLRLRLHADGTIEGLF